MPEQMTAEQREAAQLKEYGTYVALRPIDVWGARAFNTGDPVPVTHVEQGLVPDDAVAKTTTKAAAAAQNEKG